MTRVLNPGAIPSGTGWDAVVSRVDDSRDDHGKGRYRLELVTATGATAYATSELYLHDWHDPVAQGAGWASAILDPESGYPDMGDGDEQGRVWDAQGFNGSRDAADGFAGVEAERVGS